MDPLNLDEDGNCSDFLKDDYYNSMYYLRSFKPVSSQYISKTGLAKYSNALKHLLPFRKKQKTKKTLRIDEAGFFSLVTFSWMSKYIYKAYKKGLTINDIPLNSPLDACDLNAQRLESLWQKELITKGPKKASFGVAVWKFVRTRVLVGSLIFSISCFMGFISPTIFVRKLLEYLEDPTDSTTNGIIWALALTGAEIMRTMFFALYYSMSYRTALRLRSACLNMVYRKLLRMSSTRNTSTGEIINLYSLDGPRLYYMMIFGPMAIGGPILSICGFFYIYYILGAWSLLGMIIFILYYPIQYLLSRFTGYYRRKAISHSDKRIKLMTEILTSIKLIKMYAWENWFSSQIYEERKKELAEETKISYCQSAGISLAPTIPVISGIATFLIHVMTGGNLAASQAFSVLVFLTKQMKTSIQVIRDGSLSFYEGLTSVQRFKAFPIFAFVSKQVRSTLAQLYIGCVSVVKGLTSFPRFKAYSILVILHTQLRTALLNIWWGSENIVQGRIICSRFQNVLMLEENPIRVSRRVEDPFVLCIKNGFFAWNVTEIVANPPKKDKEEKEIEKENLTAVVEDSEVLHSINLTVPKGALIGVCGPVGAGKSALLLACLGQLKKISGHVSRIGTCAYVSQESWVENATLKDNILFGEHFDPKKYISVLHSCALNEDVNFLSGADETEVGERGVNLSGGQKQRVSLARALYADRDIYFLDDPFSAVDPPVGVQIFERCVLEALATKTVILVTRNLQFLQKCDQIIVMKEGRIVERGTYASLSTEGRDFKLIIESSLSPTQIAHGKIESNDNAEESNLEKEQEMQNSKSFPKKLIQSEEQLQGNVRAYAYHAYISAVGGYLVSFFVFAIILLNVGSNVFSSWWLAMWIKAGSGNTTIIDPVTNETIISRNINDNPDLPFYMQVYGSIIVLILVSCVVRGFVYTKVTIRASKILHRNLFEKVLNSPMRYFERTPIGQILNLFSRDIDEVDSRLPQTVQTMLQNIWSVMFSFLSITLVFPWFVIPLIFLAFLYYFISKIFRMAVRDLKRVENISRAPVFSAISNTVQGLSTIHAFNKENYYVSQFSKLFDENATVVYLSSNAMRWMAVRLDSISVVINFITSFLVVFLKNDVAPAFAGLALTYAAQICGVFQYTIRLMSENEARFISVERIQYNIEKLEPEGNSEPEIKVPLDWPSKGDIKFNSVTMSYGKDLPNVLNSISFSVTGGEKIGVVGRTGAGKSSLVVALFRLVELTSGNILIDGVNIARVPLHLLRSRLSLIPQDPILFSDSLRSNLDPFKKFNDADLWDVLRKIKLATKVKSLPNQLSTYVGEGENLSVGEKQLVCLARTLLLGSKILILDEATASIDPETEKAVQTTLQEEFKECTIITIAHRLSTVISCDKILVVDQGMILEFDSPEVLMKDPNSKFAKMLAATKFQ